jgi:hypothetical protein
MVELAALIERSERADRPHGQVKRLNFGIIRPPLDSNSDLLLSVFVRTLARNSPVTLA